MKGSILFLGTGSSMGIPLIGCDCPVCHSSSSFNNRLRPSILLKIDGKKLLVDATPDFRQQALIHQVNQLNGVILTHTHYDHVGGLDDLRIYNINTQKSLPCLISASSLEDLKVRYNYLFEPNENNLSFSAEFDFQVIDEDFGQTNFLGIPISFVSFYQGHMQVKGYRFGNTVYLSDIGKYDDRLQGALKGVDQLIISAPRKSPSPVHLSLPEVIELSSQLNLKRVYITHICHEMDHEEISKELPSNMSLAYDGLEIPFCL